MVIESTTNGNKSLHTGAMDSGSSACLAHDAEPVTEPSLPLPNSEEDFPVYLQSDSRWGGLWFGPSGIYGGVGATLAEGGCGPISFAMLATALTGREILPSAVADVAGLAGTYAGSAGCYWAITKILAEYYGLQYVKISASTVQEAISAVNRYLEDGWMIHTSGQGIEPFTKHGHYIGIREITASGKWRIADSKENGIENTLSKEWDPPALVAAGMNIDNIHAIKLTNISNRNRRD